MARKTPHACAGVLHDSSSNTTIHLDSPAWYAWLIHETHRSFHFTHPSGGFTARKESKQRGHTYWVAYRQVRTKLYKAYLGKSEELTEARLRTVSEVLADRSTSLQPSDQPPDTLPAIEETTTDRC